MQFLATPDEQQVVGCLLGHRMLEDVFEIWITCPLAHQLLVGQGTKMRLDILDTLIGRRRCANRCKRTVRKYPAEDLARRAPVTILPDDMPGIDQSADHFLYEERITLCLLQDQVVHARG